MKHNKPFLAILVLLLVLVIPISAQLVPRNFFFEVMKGNIPGHTAEHISGINANVGTIYEDIISPSNNYTFPTVANQVNVSSNDPDDTAGGDGAWNVTIEGLDANWVAITETLNMNGIANVTSTLSYIRINKFRVREVGSSGVNEGLIVLRNSLHLSEIIPGHGEAQYGIYSIPVNTTGLPWSLLLTSSEDKTIEYELQIREFGESWITHDEFFSFRSTIDHPMLVHEPFPGKSDVKIRARVSQTTGEVGTSLDFILVTDSVLHNSTLLWSDGTVGETVTSDPTNNALLYLLIVLLMFGLLAFGRKS